MSSDWAYSGLYSVKNINGTNYFEYFKLQLNIFSFLLQLYSHIFKLVSDEINILPKLNLKDNLSFYKIHLLPLNSSFEMYEMYLM